MGINREVYLSLLDRQAQPPSIPPQSEQAIQLACIKYLRYVKGYACGKTKTYAMPTKNGVYRKDKYAFRGYPDLTVFMPKLVFVEVKSAKGYQSQDQKWFEELCQKADIPYLLVYSLAELMEKIIEIEQGGQNDYSKNKCRMVK